MTLELLVNGPALQARRLLVEGQPELILGRSEACDLQLPDPERYLSRRHLAVWAQAGQLRFRVLSTLKGVELGTRQISPGGEGFLAWGETLQVGSYLLTLADDAPSLTEAGSTAEADLRGVFGNEWRDIAPPPDEPEDLTPAAFYAPGPGAAPRPSNNWELQTLRVSSMKAAAPHGAAASLFAKNDMSAFFRGLGLDPLAVGNLGSAELEAIGQRVRMALQGLLDMLESKADMKQELGVQEGTMLATRRQNPLKAEWPVSGKLHYLLGGRHAAIGFLDPEIALREVLTELRAHELASVAATRAAIEGVIEEFAPDTLAARLPGARWRLPLIENARIWKLFTADYKARSAQKEGWLKHVLDHYFMPAYVRESTKIKSQGSPRL